MTQSGGFNGVHVVTFESRHPGVMAELIRNHGGVPIIAPSMREVPIERNDKALGFATALLAGEFNMVIFLTGVGTRALAKVVTSRLPLEQFVAALKQVRVVARGPKPVAALNELGVPIQVKVPEPNTWRELLQAIDPLPPGYRIAVQEYGASNPELMAGLRGRGAAVTAVPVYQWDLPEDLEPLRGAIGVISVGQVDVALFTTSVQVAHLVRVASEMKLDKQLRRALAGMVVASVGPICSEWLRQHGIQIDLEPSHPKMGFLVKEAAERSAEILASKRYA
jgi:uroporphyrinogen-III synthase